MVQNSEGTRQDEIDSTARGVSAPLYFCPKRAVGVTCADQNEAVDGSVSVA